MTQAAQWADLNDPVMKHAGTDFVTVYAHSTVGEALDHIRTVQTEMTILYFYVLDSEHRLVGVVQTRRLLTSSLDTAVTDVMATNIVTVPDAATLADALEFFIFHRFLAFPVVDQNKRILGVIDVNVFTKEMIDLEEREQIHSVFDTLGVRVSELRDKSPWSVFRYRFPWLVATIASGTLCALLVGVFQATLAQSLILAFFLTLVLGLGESVAMQTMAITVHLMHHQASQSGWYFRALGRELTRTFLLAFVCATIVGGIAILWRGDGQAGAIIALGIFGSLMMASFLGVSVPALLHKLRLDVRVASGPLTLALADICTITVYFSLAALILFW